ALVLVDERRPLDGVVDLAELAVVVPRRVRRVERDHQLVRVEGLRTAEPAPAEHALESAAGAEPLPGLLGPRAGELLRGHPPTIPTRPVWRGIDDGRLSPVAAPRA